MGIWAYGFTELIRRLKGTIWNNPDTQKRAFAINPFPEGAHGRTQTTQKSIRKESSLSGEHAGMNQSFETANGNNPVNQTSIRE